MGFAAMDALRPTGLPTVGAETRCKYIRVRLGPASMRATVSAQTVGSQLYLG